MTSTVACFVWAHETLEQLASERVVYRRACAQLCVASLLGNRKYGRVEFWFSTSVVLIAYVAEEFETTTCFVQFFRHATSVSDCDAP